MKNANTPGQPPRQSQSTDTRAGFFYALSAYLLWGFLSIYIKAVEEVDAVEVIAHRAFWSLPVSGLILWWIGRTGDIVPTLKNPAHVRMLLITALIISVNWGVFVWAVSVERTLEAALGYYINPLITVAMGALLLGERFTRPQQIALAIATLAVTLLAIRGGTFPWISLVLAFSFATYGYLRKTIDVGPAQGFLIEVLLLTPLSLGYIVYGVATGQGVLFDSPAMFALMIGLGPATAIPLILYSFGAKGLSLSTIGLMQYIAPTMIFFIGLFLFKETFSFWQAVTFVMIWTALVIYSWSAFSKR